MSRNGNVIRPNHCCMISLYGFFTLSARREKKKKKKVEREREMSGWELEFFFFFFLFVCFLRNQTRTVSISELSFCCIYFVNGGIIVLIIK